MSAIMFERWIANITVCDPPRSFSVFLLRPNEWALPIAVIHWLRWGLYSQKEPMGYETAIISSRPAGEGWHIHGTLSHGGEMPLPSGAPDAANSGPLVPLRRQRFSAITRTDQRPLQVLPRLPKPSRGGKASGAPKPPSPATPGAPITEDFGPWMQKIDPTNPAWRKTTRQTRFPDGVLAA